MRLSRRPRTRLDRFAIPYRLLPVCALAVLLGVAACAQDQETGLASPTQPRRAAATRDSVAGLLTPLASVVETVPIKKGESVLVTVVSASCAAQGDVVSVSGALSGVIATDVCHVTPPPVTLGPAPQDGELLFTDSGPWGTGGTKVSGSYPDYTVSMGDGYGDGDYNDAVLSVHIICPIFDGPTGDMLLDDPEVRAVLQKLWADSHFSAPDEDRTENGGMFIRNPDGSIRFKPYNNSGTQACTIPYTRIDFQLALDSGEDVIAIVHTHVDDLASHPNLGQCMRAGKIGTEYRATTWRPSRQDMTALGRMNVYFPDLRRSYVIAPDSVYPMTPLDGDSATVGKPIPRGAECG